MTTHAWRQAPLQPLLENGEIDVAADYAEPGYTKRDPDGDIFFGNWNPPKFYFSTNDKATFESLSLKEKKTAMGMARVAEFIERIGSSVEWSDEWATCYDCSRAFRTQADSYSWQPSYIDIDGELSCDKCFFSKVEEDMLDELAENGHGIPFTDDRLFDMLEEFDYKKVNEDSFEAGLYGGQDDSPEKLRDAFRKGGVTHSIFVIDSTGQFDRHFSVYVPVYQLDAARAIVAAGGAKDVDPEAMKRGLLNMASLAPKEGHVIVTKIGNDGASVSRYVSDEDFIAGKAFDEEES